jgi:hypothetical protein
MIIVGTKTMDCTGTQTFLDYVNSFYGRDGIYRLVKNKMGHTMWATKTDIHAAICKTEFTLDDGVFCGDSIDREAVRATLEANGFSEEGLV